MEPKRKVKARDIVNDIRSRMTDPELMAKYDLSATGLQSAFIKLLDARAITQAELDRRAAAHDDKVVIRQIRTTEIVKDIQSGMTDFELMEKYNFSSEGLQKAFQSLVKMGALRPEEISGRSPVLQDTVFIECMRELPRHHLTMAVTIYEATRPEVNGTLRDITEKGVGITGIPARVGEVKTLVIPAETFTEADKIVFEAKCAWAQAEGTEDQYFAGFQITSISEECLEDLRSLIRSVCFSM